MYMPIHIREEGSVLCLPIYMRKAVSYTTVFSYVLCYCYCYEKSAILFLFYPDSYKLIGV